MRLSNERANQRQSDRAKIKNPCLALSPFRFFVSLISSKSPDISHISRFSDTNFTKAALLLGISISKKSPRFRPSRVLYGASSFRHVAASLFHSPLFVEIREIRVPNAIPTLLDPRILAFSRESKKISAGMKLHLRPQNLVGKFTRFSSISARNSFDHKRFELFPEKPSQHFRPHETA